MTTKLKHLVPLFIFISNLLLLSYLVDEHYINKHGINQSLWFVYLSILINHSIMVILLAQKLNKYLRFTLLSNIILGNTLIQSSIIPIIEIFYYIQSVLIVLILSVNPKRSFYSSKKIYQFSHITTIIVLINYLFISFISSGLPPYISEKKAQRISFTIDKFNWSLTGWYSHKTNDNKQVINKTRHQKDVLKQAKPLKLISKKKIILKNGEGKEINWTLKKRGKIKGFDYDQQNSRYLFIDDQYNISIIDIDIKKVIKTAQLDHIFLNTYNPIAIKWFYNEEIGIAFENNQLLILEEDGFGDEIINFKFFKKNQREFNLMGNKKINSSALAQFSIKGIALDPNNNQYYTIATTDLFENKKPIISSFDTLSMFNFKNQIIFSNIISNNDDLYNYNITSLTFNKGYLYTINPSYNTLIKINPINGEINSFYQLNEEKPEALSVNNSSIHVLSLENNTYYINIYDMPKK